MALLERRGHRRQFVRRIDLPADDMEVAGGLQSVQIGAHGAVPSAGPELHAGSVPSPYGV